MRRLVGISVLALVAVGCSNKGDVSGKVTYKDKPLVYGTVTFEAIEGPSIQASIKPDGSYHAAGVGTGEVKVAVNSPDPKIVGSHANWKDPSKKPPPINAPGWFAIPSQYESTQSSKLVYTVNRGDNRIDIELK
jgi:hypothetical protein